MKKKHGGKRANAGRPPLGEVAMKLVAIRLSDEQKATAKRLGNGDVSAGIRLLLDAAKK